MQRISAGTWRIAQPPVRHRLSFAGSPRQVEMVNGCSGQELVVMAIVRHRYDGLYLCVQTSITSMVTP